MRACLEEFVDRGLAVIPVKLPEAPLISSFPVSASVHLGGHEPRLDARDLDSLQWGITGESPLADGSLGT